MDLMLFCTSVLDALLHVVDKVSLLCSVTIKLIQIESQHILTTAGRSYPPQQCFDSMHVCCLFFQNLLS